MSGLAERLEKLFSAVAFAEEGEFDTAREMIKEEVKMQNNNTTKTVQPRLQFSAPGAKG